MISKLREREIVDGNSNSHVYSLDNFRHRLSELLTSADISSYDDKEHIGQARRALAELLTILARRIAAIVFGRRRFPYVSSDEVMVREQRFIEEDDDRVKYIDISLKYTKKIPGRGTVG